MGITRVTNILRSFTTGVIMNILFLILLLIAPVFAGETASNLIQEPDDMQTRVKKHLKTNKLTVFGEAITDYGFFHDRGDPAAVDFGIGDLTVDGAYHTLDLSSIIPSDSKAVLLRVKVIDDAVGGVGVGFRKNGNSNSANVAICIPQVANIPIEYTPIVICDSSQIIEYVVGTGLTVIDITILGWWK